MAQADYIVSNGTGAAVRSDINGQLAAIVSNNSGATAPATTYAYQWWADTTTNTLKLRNSANSAWIELRQLDGDFTTVSVDNGTAAAPSIYFNASGTDTGIFSSGTDAVDISTAGTRRFGIASGGDITVFGGNVTLNTQGDLRFADSDSSNFIALQAPATISSNVTLTLPSADGSNGQVLTTNGSGTLSFTTPAATSDKITEGNTEAEVVDTGSDGHFKVTTEGTERFRCDSSGRLLVGTSTSNADYNSNLQIASNSASFLASQYSSNASGPIAYFYKSRSTTIGTGTIVQNGDELGSIYFGGSDGVTTRQGALIQAAVDATPGSGDFPARLIFSVTRDSTSSPIERMTLKNNGRLGVLSDTTGDNWTLGLNSVHLANTSNYLILGNAGAAYTTDNNTGTNVFRVYTNGNVQNTNNSYGSISDIKLKENVVDANSQWNDLKALQVRNYNFKEETGQQTHTQIGLIAQEVELVSPGLVSESPDRDAEGNDLGTVTKSVNYSVLYMKAVKALQEAMERIEQLEAKVAALEAQ